MSGGNLKSQLREQYSKNRPFGKEGAKDAMVDAQDQPTTTDAAAVGGSNLRDRATANVPEDTKQSAREAMDKTRTYLDKKVPKQRREQTIWRLKKMVVEIQGHQDCTLAHMLHVLRPS